MSINLRRPVKYEGNYILRLECIIPPTPPLNIKLCHLFGVWRNKSWQPHQVTMQDEWLNYMHQHTADI